MADPFLGEIRMLPYSFAPEGWAYCTGGTLQIGQHPALFSIISTIYGGDGRTTMGLPDLKGRVPIGYGMGPGLSNRLLGQSDGEAGVILDVSEMPKHSHDDLIAAKYAGNTESPAGAYVARNLDAEIYKQEPASQSEVAMSPYALSVAGQNQAHENRQPFLAVPFCISLDGIYPSRS